MSNSLVRACIFDYYGVIFRDGKIDEELMRMIQTHLAGKYKLAILSNMAQAKWQDMLGEYAPLFDEVLLSGEIGVAKPDTRAFLVAASRLAEFPSDCVMIDDSLSNVTAAKEAGLGALHFSSPENLLQQMKEHGIITI